MSGTVGQWRFLGLEFRTEVPAQIVSPGYVIRNARHGNKLLASSPFVRLPIICDVNHGHIYIDQSVRFSPCRNLSKRNERKARGKLTAPTYCMTMTVRMWNTPRQAAVWDVAIFRVSLRNHKGLRCKSIGDWRFNTYVYILHTAAVISGGKETGLPLWMPVRIPPL
jgi:hypothetical protein